MRLPRPQRAMRVSVRPLTRQLGVGEATTYDLAHGKGEAIFVGEPVVLRRAIVEAKHLLRNVAVKVKGFNGNIGSLEAAFQQAPEVLDSVRVNLSAHILLKVVHGFVNEVLLRQFVISLSLIGIDRRLLVDVFEDRILQSFATSIGDDLCAYQASLSVA